MLLVALLMFVGFAMNGFAGLFLNALSGFILVFTVDALRGDQSTPDGQKFLLGALLATIPQMLYLMGLFPFLDLLNALFM